MFLSIYIITQVSNSTTYPVNDLSVQILGMSEQNLVAKEQPPRTQLFPFSWQISQILCDTETLP